MPISPMPRTPTRHRQAGSWNGLAVCASELRSARARHPPPFPDQGQTSALEAPPIRWPAEQRSQPLRIGRGSALLIVVEVHEHGFSLRLPLANPPGPLAERLVGIVLLVFSVRPMATHIDMTGCHLPRSWRLIVIRQTERYVMIAQHIEN